MSTRHRRLSAWIASAVLGVLLGSADAQQFPSCPLSTNGPDVVVGDITSPTNYNVVGTLDAAALGTTSCNVGNALLNWFASTVNHPLIGAGVFRYKVIGGSGRFEQIGQSWLKHASSALQGSICCVCQPGGSSSRLGVGCSDPYGGSLNGNQSSLGPKYQVNPHVGTYIAAGHPTPSGGNNGRIQMDLADLEPSSASVRYFGEATYVTLDDAQQNNGDNNSSYREMTVVVASATAGFTFGVTGTTQRLKVGVEAWQEIDPLVHITTISAPEDSSAPFDQNSRLVLASRVTDLGSGQWHYEYALHNLNSERAIASFRIPLSPTATVTNIGFRDVSYIGGDGIGGVNFDGTDWPGTFSGGVISWSTTPFATSDNANALRWGTTYNFRFDANVAPLPGTITLGQYKVVNDIQVSLADVPGVPPAFDAFCLGDGTLTDHTTPCPCGNNGAPDHGCANSADRNGAQLSASGQPATDTVVLATTNMPMSAFGMYLQHSLPGDFIFHDGTLCAGGTLIRLRGRSSVIGASQFPDPAFPQDATITLSQRGGVAPGQGVRRYYSTWYRNASTSFCPPATANVSNGWVIDW